MNKAFMGNQSEIQFVPAAFTGVGGRIAASSRSRFTPIDMSTGLALDARGCSQIDSPPSRDLMKYPGQGQAVERRTS